MRCAHCRTQNPEGAKFCLNCGTRLLPLCPQCQAPLAPQARFCTGCGSQVTASPLPEAAAPASLAEPLQRFVPQEYAERLLATRGQAVSERRLVTILFSDIKGSTAMAEALDPEDVMEIINGALQVLIEPVARHEGTLARLMGDAVLAFFGAPLSHEDDAQRAVRAALEIVEAARQYAARLEAERGIGGFDVRVGINTGLVVVGEVGTDLRVEYTAMGDAINLAARMEQHAPPGGILISHDTYRHVRGAFDVVPQQPLAVKGKAEPVQAYLVQRARPRAFHAMTRGVEGIETPMVGRENELSRLQDALHTVVEEGACQVVTVVGEAGVGKSRLLHEFDAWCEAQPARLTLFKGRVGQEMQNLPYALLRDLFSRGFEIRESDPAAVARDKLVNGWAAGFEEAEPEAEGKAEMKAHIVGQVLGFDFTASPHVQAIGDDAQQLRDRALVYLGDYFRARAARRPVLMLLEDLHWADGSSLDAVDRVAAAVWAHGRAPLLIVCAARPSLYQRRPGWGEGRGFHSRLDLDPLSRQDSRLLVGEILQHMEQVPETLRDLLVGGAEGNPFFLEELIKMLIEEGVIRKGETAWSVDAARLGDLQVPPTLTGVLQARLDRLPFDQRQVLQQASVVGRLFWDLAVAHIAAAARPGRAEAQTEAESEAIGAALAALGGREMVFPQATSAFEGAGEYLFKHALLREVTYEGVLKRVRRVYHGLVAGWLMEHAADRAGEYTGLIADHLALAGRSEEAVGYLRRAAEQAAAAYANEEAEGHYRAALELVEVEAERADLLWELGRVLYRQSRYEQAIEVWQRGIALYQALGKLDGIARLYARTARAAWELGDYPRGLRLCREGMVAVGEAPESPDQADLLHATAWACGWNGLQEEATSLCRRALEMAERMGAVRVQAEALASMGVAPDLPYEETVSALTRAVELAESAGLLAQAARAHGNLGASLIDAQARREHFLRAAELYGQRGEILGEFYCACTAAHFSLVLGDLAAVEEVLPSQRQLLDAAGKPGAAVLELRTLEFKLLLFQGELAQAIEGLQALRSQVRETGELQELAWLNENLARACIWEEVGQEEEIEAMLREALDLGYLGTAVPAKSLQSVQRARQGEPEAARHLLTAAREQAAEQDDLVRREPELSWAEANLAMAEGHWAEALAAFEATVDAMGRTNQRWYRARTLVDWAGAHLARGESGDRERARKLLREAETEFESMGAHGYVERVRGRLEELGAINGSRTPVETPRRGVSTSAGYFRGEQEGTTAHTGFLRNPYAGMRTTLPAYPPRSSIS